MPTKQLLVFTGDGISVGSGLPTFSTATWQADKNLADVL
ncbi:MAG: hypothetical protein FD169_2117 [Bacillota bacterium]|nr:MAG: hypothetical protein FD169_2117 [Bacillota bacterium]